METLEVIKKTREYLDYLEEHIRNVHKAWRDLQEKCNGMEFMNDRAMFKYIDDEVRLHDLSKLSVNEFVQYRKVFYPCKGEEKEVLTDAWEHHKANNPHHWEEWTSVSPNDIITWQVHCVHMILDWMAMGYKFGDTAQSYYEKNTDKILIPDHAKSFMYQIFDRIR